MDKLKKHRLLRKVVQLINGIVSNGHLAGFVTGRIYSGSLKKFCVPGLNCYSCPGAIGACPIGSMQAFFSARQSKFAFYVLGYLAIIGVLVGRFVCGWLCLFGLIQELLYRIPTPKIKVPASLDRVLRKTKYLVLAIFVVLLPLVLRNQWGLSAPYFCKWICPVGMLEGGIPLLALNESMRAAAGLLYAWKFAILIVVLLAAVTIERSFCKYLCPLGAFYGLFHRVGFLKLNCNQKTCTECGLCGKVCSMQVDPTVNPNSEECIRCGECVKACPASALKFTFLNKDTVTEREEKEAI